MKKTTLKRACDRLAAACNEGASGTIQRRRVLRVMHICLASSRRLHKTHNFAGANPDAELRIVNRSRRMKVSKFTKAAS